MATAVHTATMTQHKTAQDTTDEFTQTWNIPQNGQKTAGIEKEECRRIVCIGVDGSTQSEHALDWYIDNVHHQGNIVILIHSFDIPVLHAYQEMYVSPEVYKIDLQRESNRTVDIERRLVDRLRKRKIPCRFISRPGKAAEGILAVAKQEDADMIVVGNHGHGKLHRAILGSVSSYVMHHAKCPVIVCRAKAGAGKNRQSRSQVKPPGAPMVERRSRSVSESDVQRPRTKDQEFKLGEMRPRAGTGSESLLRQVLTPKGKPPPPSRAQ